MPNDNLITYATQVANNQGVDPNLVLSVIRNESNWNPDAVSPAGAGGIMQLMPATAGSLGLAPSDRFDPTKAIPAGVSYLKQQLERFGTPELALAAYNAGPGAVAKAGGIPDIPETQNYVAKNMATMNKDGSAIFGDVGPQPSAPSNDGSAVFSQFDNVAPYVFTPVKQQPSAPPDTAAASVNTPPAGYKVTITGTSADEPQGQSGGASGSWTPSGFTLGNLQHQLGLTGRAALTGSAALPSAAWNGLAGVINSALDTHIPTADANATANALGLPQPQNGQERIVQDAASALASVGGLAGPAQGILKLADAAPAVKAMPDVVSNMIGLLGKNVGTQARVAAAGSGASGAAQEAGLPAPIQVAAGLLAGGIPDVVRGRFANSRGLLAARSAVPTVDDLKQASGKLFDEATRLGVTATPEQTQQLATSMRALATNEGLITPKGSLSNAYPKIGHVINTLDDYAGSQMTVPQMQTVRKVLQDAAGSTDGAERRLGTMMLNGLDDFTSPLAPQLAEARALYSRAMRGQELEKLNDLVDLRKSQFSGSGAENAMRTEYRNLARRIVKGQERGWTPEQITAIERVAKGTPYSNTMRYVGKAAPTGVVSMGFGTGVPFALGNAIGGPALGGAFGAAVPTIGFVARDAATRSTSRLAQEAGLLARGYSRPETVQPLLSVLPGLLSAQAVQRNSR